MNHNSLPKSITGFEYNQSTKQAFYFVKNIVLENIAIDEDDWIIAYNDDVIVGSRPWLGEYTDIPVMGNDGYNDTYGYCEAGDIPQFKLYRSSTGNIIQLTSNLDLPEWNNNQIYNIELVENSNMLPSDIMLLPAYPNPFNPITNISLLLPFEQYISFGVYDIRGKKIKDIYNGFVDKGQHTYTINSSGMSSGIYFVHLNFDKGMKTQKIILIK